MLEFRKVTAPLLKFNVRSFLDLLVKIGLYLGPGPLADIARQNVSWQVSERRKISSSKRLLNPILLRIRILVQHAAQVGHLVVTRQVRPSLLVPTVRSVQICIVLLHLLLRLHQLLLIARFIVDQGTVIVVQIRGGKFDFEG